ncbi:double-strand break repair protein AddB [Rhodomicrobium vannielii ATCC 17100]|uniref:double-strand break repair protein AddB n=1 Tax=Rhodomicrobium vannielii TaxID=1069 RepID=UPI001919F862|nr:double-strand break repair protein AddB [Rhodomicrobium vannielii]MBJ7534682.1 double-strand break repair protein AddB [Rhodomicrobium vannielii ATCC 17100]
MTGGGAQLELGFSAARSSAVFACPPHRPFLPALAAAILDGALFGGGEPEPHDIPALNVYVPSQAAVTPLKLALLDLSPCGATFLPRIRVLGDADPLDMFAAYAPHMEAGDALALLREAVEVPKPLGDIERRVHLSAAAMKAARDIHSTRMEFGEQLFSGVTAASAAKIAADIASLIDDAHRERADLAKIDRLDRGHASGGEQISLQILRAVRKVWDAHKKRSRRLGQPLRHDSVDREERRNRLMALEAAFIRASDAPVIVAGSTGSVAATMGLMEALGARSRSAIVLHGLDRALDDASWQAIAEHPEHPQHGLWQLLARLGVGRDGVSELETARALPIGGDPIRAAFLSEAMRPASTTARWADYVAARKAENSRDEGATARDVSADVSLHDTPRGTLAPGLTLVEADTSQEEAVVVALILRAALEDEAARVALVTPDDALTARVRHALAAWGMASEPPAAQRHAFALRVAATAASGKPEDFTALLRLGQGADRDRFLRLAELVDLGAARQMWRPASMDGIPTALARAQHAIASGEARHPAMRRIDAEAWEAARLLAGDVLDALSPLTANAADRASDAAPTLPFRRWVAAHDEALARLAAIGLACNAGDDAPSLGDAFGVDAPSLALDINDYAAFFAELARAEPTPAAGSPHPRLSLLSPLDARLLSADVVVLGGLNEGAWPQTPGPSPWLNRQDRAAIGLSPEERRIGQAAHDFASLAAAAPRVVLTRAKKANGSLARPSRWIARITTLARGTSRLAEIDTGAAWLEMARARRMPATVTPIAPPEPRPPLSARPRRLSVTAIETWFANPYAIYASFILDLKPLRRIGESHDARDKGTLYHAALNRFFEAYPDRVPDDAAARLVACLDRSAEECGFDLDATPFWRPRFARFAEWFAATEAQRRDGLRLLKSEVGGKLKLVAEGAAGPFEVTARADRIDLGADGSLRIFDFKTSANAATTSARRGAPQLALEGMLAMEGAFAGLPAGGAPDLCYIVASGGEPPGDIVTLKAPSEEAIAAAKAGLLLRIALFDDEATPYAYEARAIFRDKADNDPYAHLARVKEWSAAAEGEDAGAEDGGGDE